MRIYYVRTIVGTLVRFGRHQIHTSLCLKKYVTCAQVPYIIDKIRYMFIFNAIGQWPFSIYYNHRFQPEAKWCVSNYCDNHLPNYPCPIYFTFSVIVKTIYCATTFKGIKHEQAISKHVSSFLNVLVKFIRHSSANCIEGQYYPIKDINDLWILIIIILLYNKTVILLGTPIFSVTEQSRIQDFRKGGSYV